MHPRANSEPSGEQRTVGRTANRGEQRVGRTANRRSREPSSEQRTVERTASSSTAVLAALEPDRSSSTNLIDTDHRSAFRAGTGYVVLAAVSWDVSAGIGGILVAGDGDPFGVSLHRGAIGVLCVAIWLAPHPGGNRARYRLANWHCIFERTPGRATARWDGTHPRHGHCTEHIFLRTRAEHCLIGSWNEGRKSRVRGQPASSHQVPAIIPGTIEPSDGIVIVRGSRRRLTVVFVRLCLSSNSESRERPTYRGSNVREIAPAFCETGADVRIAPLPSVPVRTELAAESRYEKPEAVFSRDT